MRRARTATAGVITTIVLPETLHSSLGTLCEELDTSMRSFIAAAVRERMARLTIGAAA